MAVAVKDFDGYELVAMDWQLLERDFFWPIHSLVRVHF